MKEAIDAIEKALHALKLQHGMVADHKTANPFEDKPDGGDRMGVGASPEQSYEDDVDQGNAGPDKKKMFLAMMKKKMK